MATRKRGLFLDIIRFCIVGSTSVTVQFLTLIIGVEVLYFNPTFSSGIGFIAACTVNYLLLYYWAFSSDTGHHLVVPRYLGVMSCTMTFNVLVFWFFTEVVDMWYVFSQCIATCCSAFFSFLLNRHFTFVPR